MQGGQSCASPVVTRTCIFDELILQTIARHKVDAILNLGAGFDTRPYRLPLPRTLRWIEVDRPEVLSYKERQLKKERANCNLERIKLDLCNVSAREKVLQYVNENATRVLVVCEGVLIYFTETQVATLASDLHKHRKFRCWLVDYVSSGTLAFLKYTLGSYLNGNCAQPNFAPEDVCKFFQKNSWKVSTRRSLWDEARRLKREPPWMRSMRSLGFPASGKFINEFRWKDGCALLHRSSKS